MAGADFDPRPSLSKISKVDRLCGPYNQFFPSQVPDTIPIIQFFDNQPPPQKTALIPRRREAQQADPYIAQSWTQIQSSPS
jgi:hypothetical protein